MEGKLLLGGEVRRLHIIYFLTHMGKTEQPHLVRVHHLTRTGGVYLRDVKRWLGELRGKDMPDSYAWSYKRRYKTGYVWQDLLDEDLITPLSDNEYVLKGSEIVLISTMDDEKNGNYNSTKHVEDIPKTRALDLQDSKTNPPSRIFSEINEEESSSSFGSERSSLTEEFDSAKFEVDQKGLDDEKIKITNHAHHNLESKKEKIEPSKGRKSFSGGVRNFITCGGVDTNDAVLVKVKSNLHCSQDDSMNLISARHDVIKCDHRIGRSSRVFGACFDHSEEKIRLPPRQTSASARKSFHEANASKNHERARAIPASQMPMREPNCSQCGKPFKPQNLHSHMKSCKGMKNSSKSSIGGASVGRNSVSNSQLGSMNSIYKESSLGHLLKH